MLETKKAQAREFLAESKLSFAEANALWKALKKGQELSMARAVLHRLRCGEGLLDPADRSLLNEISTRELLCQQEALLTSKDPELSAAFRHDKALEILSEVFTLWDGSLDQDAETLRERGRETLGIAGGIYKRRWGDLGQLGDLMKSADLYGRGAKGPLGDDAYTQINAAFVFDLLAEAGVEPQAYRDRAKALRETIAGVESDRRKAGEVETSLPGGGPGNETGERFCPNVRNWWNVASRAEANFGLYRYEEARLALAEYRKVVESGEIAECDPWELQTFAQQLSALAHLQRRRAMAEASRVGPAPAEPPPAESCRGHEDAIRRVFQQVLPDGAEAIPCVLTGKVGLALSGGGFRASFYHLGVLARLAELDVLRKVEVLSCVSGGSIVGAFYWLLLRARLMTAPLSQKGYVDLVNEVIVRFEKAVATGVREAIQPSKAHMAQRLLFGEKGLMSPVRLAQVLEETLYRPLIEGPCPLYMHHLKFTPSDHRSGRGGSNEFKPSRDNWRRADKVPALVLNATTVNTAHTWHFTPTWMGESPWTVHETADSVPRLDWSEYSPQNGWQMELGRAVAASASVPLIFAPLRLRHPFDGIEVQLVDGGVHDNQGTAALLGMDCNVLLVSDAAGQLLLEESPRPGPLGFGSYSWRTMNILMERVRLAKYGELEARRQSGLLRGLMFLHMKAGLTGPVRRQSFSQTPDPPRRTVEARSGVHKEIQQALAELRTDLDVFTTQERYSLMACGYLMATRAFQRDFAHLPELSAPELRGTWPFKGYLKLIAEDETHPASGTAADSLSAETKRAALLRALRGSLER